MERVDFNLRLFAKELTTGHLYGWRYLPDVGYDHYVYLRHVETGAQCTVSWHRMEPGKINFGGVYPDLPDGSKGSAWLWGFAWEAGRDRPAKKAPGISVSTNRTYDAIAADFKRRFEREFMDVWQQCMAKATTRLVEYDKATQVLERCLIGDSRKTPRYTHGGTVYGGEWRAEVQVLSASEYRPMTVELELSGLTPDVAAAVVRLVAARQGLKKPRSAEDDE